MARITRFRSLVYARAIIGLALGFAATSSHAATLTLQDLLNGQTIVVGHVEFGNFHNYFSTGTGGALAVDPAEIIVTPLDDLFGSGLAFESGAFGVDPGQSKHWSFEFDGSVIGVGPPLEGMFLWIQEALFEGPGGVVTSDLQVEPLGQPPQHLIVRRTYDDRTKEYMEVVLSDALVSRFKMSSSSEIPPGESSSLNFAKMEMEYKEQRPTPEPTTLTLVGLITGGLLALRRRPRR